MLIKLPLVGSEDSVGFGAEGSSNFGFLNGDENTPLFVNGLELSSEARLKADLIEFSVFSKLFSSSAAIFEKK